MFALQLIDEHELSCENFTPLTNYWFNKHRDYFVRDRGCRRDSYFPYEWHFCLRAFDVSIQEHDSFIPIIRYVGVETHLHHRFSFVPRIAPNRSDWMNVEEQLWLTF